MFFESLREVNNSEKVLKARRILREGINFSDNDVYINDNISELVQGVNREINNMIAEALESVLNENSKKVASTTTGYIA